MKKAAGWIGSWTLFWMGDAANRLLCVSDTLPQWWFDVWCRIYQRLMRASYEVQCLTQCKGPWERL